MQHKVFLLGLTILTVCLLTSVSSATLVNRIVAVVNGELITLHDLKSEMESGLPGMGLSDDEDGQQSQAMQRRVLQAMINDKLLAQEAERFEVGVSDVAIDNQIEQIKKERDLSQSEFRQALQAQGLTLEEYRQTLREEMKKNKMLSMMVRQKVVVSDKEMRTFYQEHKQDYHQPKQVHLRLIVHPNRERVQQVRQAIRAGEMSFAQGARTVSQGPGAEEGGDLGQFAWKDLKPQWKVVLRPLQPGEVSQVFSLQDMYAILLLESVIDQQVKDYQEVKEDIRRQIYSRKLEKRYQEYMKSLRAKALIDVRLHTKK